VAASLALVSAMCFALAAALQQRGQFALAHAGAAVRGLAGLVRLVAVLSLATGQLAPAMAAVSVANPAISVILGILLFEERLTRPGWHVVVAAAALLAALGGAVLITLANRETQLPGEPTGRSGALTGEMLR
jgi:hypothetical protein